MVGTEAQLPVLGWRGAVRDCGAWISVQDEEFSLLLQFIVLGVWLPLEVGWLE